MKHAAEVKALADKPIGPGRYEGGRGPRRLRLRRDEARAAHRGRPRPGQPAPPGRPRAELRIPSLSASLSANSTAATISCTRDRSSWTAWSRAWTRSRTRMRSRSRSRSRSRARSRTRLRTWPSRGGRRGRDRGEFAVEGRARTSRTRARARAWAKARSRASSISPHPGGARAEPGEGTGRRRPVGAVLRGPGTAPAGGPGLGRRAQRHHRRATPVLLTHVPLSLEGDVDIERGRWYKTTPSPPTTMLGEAADVPGVVRRTRPCAPGGEPAAGGAYMASATCVQ